LRKDSIVRDTGYSIQYWIQLLGEMKDEGLCNGDYLAGPVLRGCISMHCTPKKIVCTLN
jgi:hypothetical protein